MVGSVSSSEEEKTRALCAVSAHKQEERPPRADRAGPGPSTRAVESVSVVGAPHL